VCSFDKRALVFDQVGVLKKSVVDKLQNLKNWTAPEKVVYGFPHDLRLMHFRHALTTLVITGSHAARRLPGDGAGGAGAARGCAHLLMLESPNR
jgi:hypothetical protein